jgi:hypothetical protein
MPTGQLVFEGDTSMKMFVEHLQTPPIPPSERTEMPIPRELGELVLACLETVRCWPNADEACWTDVARRNLGPGRASAWWEHSAGADRSSPS